MELMTDRRIRHVPIVEGGRLFGMISMGDTVSG
jgi:CBS domain-containing protein